VSFDQILAAIKDIGLPTTMLLLIGFAAWRFVQGPGNEALRALVAYLRAAHEQLLTLPTVVRDEAERSRDAIARAHLETRAYLQNLLQGNRTGDTPEPPTPQEPAIRRASGDFGVVLPPPVPPPPRRPMGSRPDLGSNGDRPSLQVTPGRPPSPSRP